MSSLTFSYSKLGSYMECPKMFYFSYILGLGKLEDYARLCGTLVHQFVKELYKPTKDGRPFWYKTKQSMIKAWFIRWKLLLEKEAGNIQVIDEKKANEYGTTGAVCLANYWEINQNRPRPIASEKRFTARLASGIKILGIFDQLREVSLEYIQRVRPDLVVDGQLHPDYNPVVIVDLKTNRFGPKPRDVSDIENARKQMQLHTYLQPTAYTWLYEHNTGKKPIGFIWWHLRSGDAFFTYRTSEDYRLFFEQINHVLLGIEAESYPVHPGDHCQYCDYFAPCRGGRALLITKPGSEFTELTAPALLETAVVVEPEKQMRFRFPPRSIERKKKAKKEASAKKGIKPEIPQPTQLSFDWITPGETKLEKRDSD